MAEKVIGIIGGMGPEATLDLFRKIIKATPARCDQEHLRVIIDNNPKIPDRVKSICRKGENSAPALIATAKNLERAGAQLLLMPCNAAHYFYEKIAKSISIPLLHMVEETATYCQRRFSRIKTFGLLAGTPTLESGLYSKVFGRIQGEVVAPKSEEQEKVMECIYDIKAGDLGSSVKAELVRMAQTLHIRGAGAIILGCTEIPLVLEDGDLPFPLIDPTQILAEAAVAIAREWPAENRRFLNRQPERNRGQKK